MKAEQEFSGRESGGGKSVVQAVRAAPRSKVQRMERTGSKQEHRGGLLLAARGSKAQSAHMLLERGHRSLAFIFLFLEGPLKDEAEVH